MKIAMFAACGVIAGSALAKPPVQVEQYAGTLRAVQFAKIRKISPTQFQIIGEWQQSSPFANRSTANNAFDRMELCDSATGLEPNASSNAVEGGFPVGFVSATATAPGCDGIGSRWFFGADYNNSHSMSSFITEPGFEGAPIAEINVEMRWAPAAATPMFAVYFPYDTLNETGVIADGYPAFDPDGIHTAFPADGGQDGVILDFGSQANPGGYFILSSGDLTALGMTVPAGTGTHAMEIFYMTDADGDGLLDFLPNVAGDGIGAQPMIWFTGEAEVPSPQLDRNGTGSFIQYDDDGGADGTDALDFWFGDEDADANGGYDEAYDYGALGLAYVTSAAFQIIVGAGCDPLAADFNNDGSVDFFDYDDFVLCFETPACPEADFNNDGSVDFFDYDDFVIIFETPC